MAQVRITDRLRSEINHKVEALRRTEQQTLVDTLTAYVTEAALVPEVTKLAEMEAWGKFYDTPTHRDTPVEWVCISSRPITINLMVKDRRVYYINIPPVRLPPTYSEWSPSVEVQLSDLSQQLQERIQQQVTDMKAINTKYADIENGLKSILDAFISLNAAVKHTPALMLYLPQDVRAKLEEKTTRTKKDIVELPVVNDELLAAVGVTHALR